MLTLDFKAAAGEAAGLGPGGILEGNAVVVDAAGNTYLAGGAQNAQAQGRGYSLCASKYDPSGALLWTRTIGDGAVYTPAEDLAIAEDIAVDAAGCLYLTGLFRGPSVDFSNTPGRPMILSAPNRLDVFVVKLNPDGSTAYASQSIDPSGHGVATGIAVDGMGNAVIAGNFATGTDPSTGQPYEVAIDFGGHTLSDPGRTSPYGHAGFIARLGSDGSFTWAVGTHTIGTSTNRYSDIALDGSGNVYANGEFSGTAVFNPGAGQVVLDGDDGGEPTAFVEKLSPDGTFVFVKAFHGPRSTVQGIAVDGAGNIFTTGNYAGAVDFDPSPGSVHTLDAGPQGTAQYLSKLDTDGTFAFAIDIGPSSLSPSNGGVAVDRTGNVYLTGGYFNAAVYIGRTLLPKPSGFGNVFVAQVSNEGEILQARAIVPAASPVTNGGRANGPAVAVNASGVVAVAGSYNSTLTAGKFTLPVAEGDENAYFATLTNRTPGDYDGDGRADLAVYNRTNAAWSVLYSAGGGVMRPFGPQGHDNVPLAGDYDGDGRADVAVYDRTDSAFSILYSGVGGLIQQFGAPGHDLLPISADYDGDGRADLAVYDRTIAFLSVLYSGGTGGMIRQFGPVGHDSVPTAGDYDGDGKADISIYDRTTATFSILYSGGGGLIQPFGDPGHDLAPAAGDYDGDGRADLAVYDRTTAALIALYSSGGGALRPFGWAGHDNTPTAGDYDGDGKADLAIYDRTDSAFSILYSGGGGLMQQFGEASQGLGNQPMLSPIVPTPGPGVVGPAGSSARGLIAKASRGPGTLDRLRR